MEAQYITDEAKKKITEIAHDYGKLKERLYVRLCNRERNADSLEGIPHKDILEFAMTCHAGLGDILGGDSSLVVTKSLIGSLGIKEEQLFEDAMENSQRIKPPVTMPVTSFLEKAAGEEPGTFEGTFPGPGLVILSTAGFIHGAAAVFYPGFLEGIAEKLGGGFFLIPSSVHEFLCLPDTGLASKEEVESLINEVNYTQVLPGDILSGRLYRFDPDEGRIALA